MAQNLLSIAIPNAPLLDPDGNVTTVWRSFFRVLLARTGGSLGVSSSSADARITAETANRIAAVSALGTALNAETATRASADAAETAERAAVDADLAERLSGNSAANGAVVNPRVAAFGAAFFMGLA